MRKSSKIIIIAGALAALAVPSVASANVAVTNGVGNADKGDVQSVLGWNNPAFDAGADSVSFTDKTVSDTDHAWTCSDGSTHHSHWTFTITTPVKATAVKNANGKQITGWNLTGKDYAAMTFTQSGTPSPSHDCPAGSTVTGISQTPSSTSGLYVNDVALPNTPVL